MFERLVFISTEEVEPQDFDTKKFMLHSLALSAHELAKKATEDISSETINKLKQQLLSSRSGSGTQSTLSFDTETVTRDQYQMSGDGVKVGW